MKNSPDTILIERIKSGDSAAFNLLINNYKNKLFGYLLKLCKDVDAAEDLFQETVIKTWKGLKNYNEKNRFPSWLFSIAHNIAIDNIRKNKTVIKNFDPAEIEKSEEKVDLQKEYEENEMKNIINSIVEKLPDKQKQVFLLRQHGGIKFSEIAEMLNEPINTVLSHMNYAVKRIKKDLRDKNVI
ncbi:MAG: RNA polymerase sigma factor [Ignavibacteria bacterium]|jgi:RNA polymerase sigma-70 factor (ECF subfamily)